MAEDLLRSSTVISAPGVLSFSFYHFIDKTDFADVSVLNYSPFLSVDEGCCPY